MKFKEIFSSISPRYHTTLNYADGLSCLSWYVRSKLDMNVGGLEVSQVSGAEGYSYIKINRDIVS
jgi:hypothetical protein